MTPPYGPLISHIKQDINLSKIAGTLAFNVPIRGFPVGIIIIIIIIRMNVIATL